jgi:hypothetical protein
VSSIQTDSRKALHELIDLLREVDEHWAGPERNLNSPEDVAGAHRALMHMLEGGLVTFFEDDPDHPQFRRIVTPSRKFTGDNSDAIYFDAPIRPGLRYRVCGEKDGAVYVSLTLEVNTRNGEMGNRTAGVINDTEFDVRDGRFEIFLGGEPRDRNWLDIDPEATRITTRHYYEEEQCAAADPNRQPHLSIEVLDDVSPAPAPDDASIAAGMRRVARFVRSRTLEMPLMGEAEQPPFVSIVPNQFPKPVKPGDFGLAAFDAAYSMAPYVIGPDQALVVRGRWPECRMANVCLWTRQMQTFDFANRQVSLNRKQTSLESDGSFRIVFAHQDPGLPNWIDTEGRPFGLVFWRYMLPEGDIVTPESEVVSLADLAAG